jgi:hypothetical protein
VCREINENAEPEMASFIHSLSDFYACSKVIVM